MDRYLSPVLFTAEPTKRDGASSQAAYVLRTAAELGFKEDWLQNAIANEPELVIAPCREAELVDEGEKWCFWTRELTIRDVGSIDVLLMSQSGRVAVVETKLSYNPEGRRSVLAQLLDYAVHLPEVDATDLPALPAETAGSIAVSVEQVRERIQQGDFLLIVAGDQLDSRAVKLGRSLLGDHLVNEWSLALVELAVFSKKDGFDGPQHLLVPHLRGVVVPEQRQVVKVVVEGAKTRVTVERLAPTQGIGSREKWSEGRFFSMLEASSISTAFKNFGGSLRELREQFPAVELSWGTGKRGSATLKRNGQGLVEFYLDARLMFRKEKFPLALGEQAGQEYLEGLQQLFPEQMRMPYPNVPTMVAEPRLGELLALLKSVLKKAT